MIKEKELYSFQGIEDKLEGGTLNDTQNRINAESVQKLWEEYIAQHNIPAVVSEDTYSYKTGLFKSDTAQCVYEQKQWKNQKFKIYGHDDHNILGCNYYQYYIFINCRHYGYYCIQKEWILSGLALLLIGGAVLIGFLYSPGNSSSSSRSSSSRKSTKISSEINNLSRKIQEKEHGISEHRKGSLNYGFVDKKSAQREVDSLKKRKSYLENQQKKNQFIVSEIG